MMEAFDRLTPALQYQIVNGLGWRGLRPVQEESVQAILDGYNCVILAPTAGGKTEAAFFPLLSMLDAEDLAPTSVLYIAPIRALLNNQEARLDKLTGMLGRRAMKWHGDVGASKRKRFIAEPADVLAITPESLEAMLMSTRTPGKELLSKVRAVVIDEVHAFASDDRGAHLVALIERICRLSQYDVQRIGLSATVGDPEAICEWLTGSSARPGRVVNPGGPGKQAELSLDFVGGLNNAALMIDRLYPGSRRLVFVDSRRRVEELGDHLQQRDVNVFVSHSSLAASDRHAAERAFEEGNNCVIVATSALELGIDVGDLEYVLQIDSPATVASFLQRMGRTGRRAETSPNCTFLATTDEATWQSAALLRLHEKGFVEPTSPTRWAPHIIAHQLLGLSLQQFGVPTSSWWEWLDGCAAFSEVTHAQRMALCEHMVSAGILVEVDGRYLLGERGETLYGAKHFMELFAVFSVPATLKVMHGNREVGTIDAFFAQARDTGPLCFVLGSRAWEVTSINWRRGVCTVKPAAGGTYPRWVGRPVLLSQALCRAMFEVLRDEGVDPSWSQRACEAIERVRQEHSFVHDGPAPLVNEPDSVRWWTFGGGRANTLLATLLQAILGEKVTANNHAIRFSGAAAQSDAAIRQAIDSLRVPGALSWELAGSLLPERATSHLSKFQPCMPETQELELAARTLLDVEGAQQVLNF